MTDLTNVFSKGLNMSRSYSCYDLIIKINNLDYISCDYDDEGANWAIIWGIENNQSKTYGFLSIRYPVALISNDCPCKIVSSLTNSGVLTAPLDSSFSCDEAILKRYAPDITILDDRFLEEDDFSLDDERMFYVYNNIKYVTPYSFTFNEIR